MFRFLPRVCVCVFYLWRAKITSNKASPGVKPVNENCLFQQMKWGDQIVQVSLSHVTSIKSKKQLIDTFKSINLFIIMAGLKQSVTGPQVLEKLLHQWSDPGTQKIKCNSQEILCISNRNQRFYRPFLHLHQDKKLQCFYQLLMETFRIRQEVEANRKWLWLQCILGKRVTTGKETAGPTEQPERNTWLSKLRNGMSEINPERV